MTDFCNPDAARRHRPNRLSGISAGLLSACLGLLLLVASPARAAELDYYLPEADDYLAEVPRPESLLGFAVGDWHVRPEQLAAGFKALAAASPRMTLIETGRTHERRPLLLAVITSPENHARLETLRQAHLAGAPTAPLVTWLGYSVHGNEASGANSALLLAYHLTAARDAATLAQLERQIILLDPMLNPDGLARFAHWANMHRSRVVKLDPLDQEHNEPAPNGRTNHYWFDLNRDWLLAQHPESVARLRQFHRWRPHLLTDHHEMGSNTTFFFQPGVRSRHHPLIPSDNYPLTGALAEFHARALDALGSLYYSREDFDDFYFGKGSTYPDIHGGIGILFEQASVRGHERRTDYGELTFPFAIRNQLTVALSTLEAAQRSGAALRALRLAHREEAAREAEENRNRALVLHTKDDFRRAELQRLLGLHQISVYPLARELTLAERSFPAQESLVIPYRQAQYRLIRALFEVRTEFADPVFYDVSAWNLALAFDMEFAEVGRVRFSESLLGDPVPVAPRRNVIDPGGVAAAFDWSDFRTVALLGKLQQEGVLTIGLLRPGRYETADGQVSLAAGSILVPLQQAMPRAELTALLERQADLAGARAFTLMRGLALAGPDLGSRRHARVLHPVKPLLLVGAGVRSYDAGEVWHFLDQRLSQPVTLITQARLEGVRNLGDYTHLLMADGNYDLDKATRERLAAWVREGGVIIAARRGAEWLLEQGWLSSRVKQFDRPMDLDVAYADKQRVDAEQLVGGAIALVELDTTHPLAFGLDDGRLPMFKRSELAFTQPREAFVRVARLAASPRLAGYLSDAVIKHIQGSASMLIQRHGKGRLVAFSDNLLFRAFWLGSARVYANALYYAAVTDAPEKSPAPDAQQDRLGGTAAGSHF